MKGIPTWRYLMSMARYKPWLYLLHGVLWGIYGLSWFLIGLIAQAFFDLLTGHSHLPGGITSLIVLLVVLACGRVVLWLCAGSVEILMRFTMSGLLRRNLLRHMLQRPGARALPCSIGETISRLRDDAHQAEDDLDWTDEIVGQGLFAVGAFLVLLRLDVLMPLVVVLPLVAGDAPGALGPGILLGLTAEVDPPQLGGHRERIDPRRLGGPACPRREALRLDAPDPSRLRPVPEDGRQDDRDQREDVDPANPGGGLRPRHEFPTSLSSSGGHPSDPIGRLCD